MNKLRRDVRERSFSARKQEVRPDITLTSTYGINVIHKIKVEKELDKYSKVLD